MKINAKILSKKAKAPIFAYCRKLISQGANPDERLEIYRNSYFPDVIVPKIGEAAKLHVLETPREGPRFVKFNSWSPSTGKKINAK